MPASKVKTDNAHVRAKLDLRRHFLRTYHADGSANVLDCCQGSAVLWSTLRREFKLAGYWVMVRWPIEPEQSPKLSPVVVGHAAVDQTFRHGTNFDPSPGRSLSATDGPAAVAAGFKGGLDETDGLVAVERH